MGSRVLLPSTGAWEEVQEVLNEQKAIGLTATDFYFLPWCC